MREGRDEPRGAGGLASYLGATKYQNALYCTSQEPAGTGCMQIGSMTGQAGWLVGWAENEWGA